MKRKLLTAVVVTAGVLVLLSGCKKKEEDCVKIGLLHSLTGTMAISETPVRDSELLAIKEINELSL